MSGAGVPVTSQEPLSGPSPRRAIPVLLGLFLFVLIIDNGFRYVSLSIAEDLSLSATTVSLQATLTGVIIGVGAVVYAALADVVSIRRLLFTAIILIAVGSALGFLGREHFLAVLIGRVVQTTGIAAAETLYAIHITKHFSGNAQKKYLGFGSAAFQVSLLIGSVGGGYIATYVDWSWLFLVALVPLCALPVVAATVAPEARLKAHVDMVGLFLIGVIATAALLFLQNFAWGYLLPLVAALLLLARHTRRNPRSILDDTLLKNRRYISILVVVFVVYSVELGYNFMFPFMMSDLYSKDLSQSSVLLIPGLIVAMCAGIFSGKVAQYLSSRRTAIAGLAMIAVAMLVPAFVVDAWSGTFVISMALFAGGFSLSYAPMVQMAIRDVPDHKKGVAIGVYNLTINIALPIGIAYTAKLLDIRPTLLAGVTDAASAPYAAILLALGLVAFVGLTVFTLAAGTDDEEPAPREEVSQVTS